MAQTAKPRILVLATGGTIAQTDSKEAKLLGDALIGAVPQLKDIAQVQAEQVAQVSSPDITPEIWLKLAKRINAALASNDVDGVVVTHGTDTLEETAYFLDLVVKSDKPVVVVGSMRGSSAPSADGPANLIDAVAIAASPTARSNGVLVTLNDTIQSARDVTKTNTTSLDAFKSPDFGTLGIVQGGKPIFYRQVSRKHTTATEFDVSSLTALPKVAIVYSYVGVDADAFEGAMKSGAKGVVYAGTGNGSIPKAVQPAAASAAKSGVVVVRASRVNGGVVERNGEHDDTALGTITADSLNPQKARVLVMLGLTRTGNAAEMQRLFDTY
ncbi:asparaginase [Methylobacterium sp. OT2]|nr:asparaginase [Methylobacterium sp. OT2]